MVRLERHWLKRRFKGCTSGEQKSSLKPAPCAPLASSNSFLIPPAWDVKNTRNIHRCFRLLAKQINFNFQSEANKNKSSSPRFLSQLIIPRYHTVINSMAQSCCVSARLSGTNGRKGRQRGEQGWRLTADNVNICHGRDN